MMNPFSYIDPYAFFISLAVGLLLAYITTPPPDVLIKHPTPENAGKVVYRDNADVCYKYRAERISCPADLSKVKDIPIQH